MKSEALKIWILLFVLFLIAIIGTIGFSFIENLSLIDSIYFTLVTIATVGYGDIHPTTYGGKVLAIVLIIGGVGTFGGVLASITDLFLEKREKINRIQKLHMLSGLFFSELGNQFLCFLCKSDKHPEQLSEKLLVKGTWDSNHFNQAREFLRRYDYNVEIIKINLEDIVKLFREKGEFLLRLLENPLLHEHEHFSELIRAIFHLREELLYRQDLLNLPESDYAHLAIDIKRVYALLVPEWINYMEYLKNNYPYLFSLASRTNPFDSNSSVVINN